MSKGKKNYATKLFDIRRVETKNGPAMKVQFPKNVEVLVDGEKVDLGEYNSIFLRTKKDIIAGLEKGLEKGLTQDFVDKQIEYLEEKGISSVAEVLNK